MAVRVFRNALRCILDIPNFPYKLLHNGDLVDRPSRETKMGPIERRHDHKEVCISTIMLAVVLPSISILSAFLVKWLVLRKPQKEVAGGGGRLTTGGL